MHTRVVDRSRRALAADDEILMSRLDVKRVVLIHAAQIAPPSCVFPKCFKSVSSSVRSAARSIAVQHRMLLKIDKGGTIETSSAAVTSDR